MLAGRLAKASAFSFKNVGRLSRAAGCDKLEPLDDSIHRAIKLNKDRINKAYDGISLQHTLALLTALVNTRRFDEYEFTENLFQKTMGGLEPYTKKLNKERFPLELVIDLVDCLVGLEKVNNLRGLTNYEQDLIVSCLYIIRKNIILLNETEVRLVKDIAKRLYAKKETFDDKVRIALDSFKREVKKMEKMNDSQFTTEYFKTFGLESYLETERDFHIHYNRSYKCLEINKMANNTKFALFCMSHHGPVDQINNFKRYMEEEKNIDSFVAELSPVLDPTVFKKPDPADQKFFEYSQSLINDWPYQYKFHGREDLRKLYFSLVFDKEFYEEKDLLFYYKVDEHSRVLDITHTLMAYFSGFGDRTKAPSVYMSSLLPEERTIEATYAMSNERAKQLCDIHSLFHLLGGMKVLEDSQVTGCQHCGGSVDLLPYYQTMDKIHRAEFESAKLGYIKSSVLMEAFQRLPEGTTGVYACGPAGYDRSLPKIFDMIRQTRLADFDPLSFKRDDHIKQVYKESRQSANDTFFERLAYVENILGSLESTLCQFVDLTTNEQKINNYERIKCELNESNTLNNWDPSFQDSNRKQFCLAENTVLPFAIDSSKYDKPIWYIGNKKEANIVEKLKEKIDAMEKSSDEEKHGRGRKIKVKSRAPLMDKGRIPEGFYDDASRELPRRTKPLKKK